MKPAQRFEDFPTYTPIEPFEVLSARLGIPVEQIVKLDANENPYGPSPRARHALTNLAYTHIYPDPESRALRQELSAFTGVPSENLLAGAGADELIDLLLRVMVEPGDLVLNFPPTFSMYGFDARLNAARVMDIPRRDDFSLDVETIQQVVEAHLPKILFLTSPNNPDGRLITPTEFDTILHLPVMVVLDEAYIEFSDDDLGRQKSRIGLVSQHSNLVVLRTFSKWAGLAGLRVGYGAFPDWLLPVLWKAKQPYNVNVAAAAAAQASLGDLAILKENVAFLKNERENLFLALQKISFLRPMPSQANFVLCQVTGRKAKDIKEALMKKGILVRYYQTPLLKDFIRISVGQPQDTVRLIYALKDME
jgi:histidinol-phosphate aminotransferase